ncbi:MAG: hypothetical protein JSV88_08915 [Candidatus Aminicenantes bacterium]|nr:MAG: hypothetical protein JSV88_08915 [Candidatus Aminicenantes bacterium]
MTTKMQKIFIKWWIIAIVAIMGFFIVIWNVSDRPPSSDSEDDIGAIALKLLEDNRFKLEKGTWYFVVILKDLGSNYSFLKYIDYLFVDIFNDYKLKLIIFESLSTATYKESIKKNRIRASIFPIPAGDATYILGLLQGTTQQRAVCFIDTSGNVVFEANFVRENDVRLLLEKYLIGNIDYDRRKDFALKPGDSFNPIAVINIKTGEEIIIDKDMCPHLWFIFTSNCVSCALKSNLMTYSIIENSLLQKFNLTAGLLFSPYFSMKDIESKINKLKIVNDVFLAKDELKGIENSYYKSADSEDNVVIIITNSKNKIVYHESFTDFLDHLKGDYFEKNKQIFIKD